MEIRFAFGSLLTLVLFGSRGGGLPDALSFFGMRGYESSYLDGCVMFSSFFFWKEDEIKVLWLMYYLSYLLVLIIYFCILFGATLYIYVSWFSGRVTYRELD